MIFVKLSTIVLASLLWQVFGVERDESLSSKETVRIEGNISETIWRYVDEDMSYQLRFASNGQLMTTHPHDHTPANDVWEQSSGSIQFSYNNNFSVYTGKMVNEGLIEGTAYNKSHTWKWKAYRVDVN